jgi:predicted DNA-binding protein
MPAIEKYPEVTHIRLSREQKQWLTKEAKRRGVTMGALVRDSLQVQMKK